MINISEIRKRAESATPGPWSTLNPLCPPAKRGALGLQFAVHDPDGVVIASAKAGTDNVDSDAAEADATFIAASRTDVIALCDEVERLRACVVDAVEVAALRVQRDEAVARLAAIKNPAPFPSERFVATVIAMMPEWFNDEDATDSFRALTKALRDAAEDLPRDTPAVIIERATGVPEAPTENVPPVHLIRVTATAAGTPERLLEAARRSVSLIKVDGELFGLCVDLQRSPPAAPPVAEDAEALLDALKIAQHRVGPCKESGNGGHWRSTPEYATCIFCKNAIGGPEDIAWEKVAIDARNAVLSRMSPPVTADALWAELSMHPFAKIAARIEDGEAIVVSLPHLRAALATLDGGGK